MNLRLQRVEVRVLRLQADGLAHRAECAVKIPAVVQHMRQRVVRKWKIRREGDGTLRLILRLGELLLVREADGEQRVRECGVGVSGEHLPQLGDGQLVPTLFEQHERALELGRGHTLRYFSTSSYAPPWFA